MSRIVFRRGRMCLWRLRLAPLIALFAISIACAGAKAAWGPEPGVPAALAAARRDAVTDLRYEVFYRTHIRDVYFYDEQSSRLLPWLIPDLLNRAFGPGFNEDDKNRLKEEAKQQAGIMAKDFVEKMRTDVQGSARKTLEALGTAFGARAVTVDFGGSELIQTKVDSVA